MAMLIKKQILKHLSKFAKNLSADSINLSTFKGEGELFDLDLDPCAIQDLVNLPTWLKITQATCNKVTVKIPWTKLGNSPITIILDSVDVIMATCEKPRAPNGPSPIQASSSGGDASYGIIQRVLEGIALRIDSINVNFISTVFKAEFQLAQLVVVSTDPEGRPNDLRNTRINNKEAKQVLTFKKLSWQTMRIVIDTTLSNKHSTPIRLITNKAHVQITLRRKTTDLSLIASRLHLKFDDLQWIFTISQLHSAMLCVKSIKDIIEKSIKQQPQEDGMMPGSRQTTKTDTMSQSVNSGDVNFVKHLIYETSFHFDLEKMNLVICDDNTNDSNRNGNGALLITLKQIEADHYPSHKAGKNRNHFRSYNATLESRDKWADEIISKFRENFIHLKKNIRKKTATSSASPAVSSSKLLESCFILRLGDLIIGQVTSSSDSKRRKEEDFISSQKPELHLPEDSPVFSLQITNYFYPDHRDYPAPHNNIYLSLCAPLINIHIPTLLWCHQLATSTIQSVRSMLADLGLQRHTDDVIDDEHTDIRIKALMPKIYLPFEDPVDEDSPDGIEIQISDLSVTNCRFGKNSSIRYLRSLLDKMDSCHLNNNRSTFPSRVEDFPAVCETLKKYANQFGLSRKASKMTAMALKSLACEDVWSVWIRQIWCDFIKYKTDEVPNDLDDVRAFRKVNLKKKEEKERKLFLDSFPLNIWITQKQSKQTHEKNMKLLDYYKTNCENNKEADTNILMHSEKVINLKLNHHQMVSLLKLSQNLQEILSNLDQSNSLQASSSSLGLRFLLPALNLHLVLQEVPNKPSQSDATDDVIPFAAPLHSRTSSMTSLASVRQPFLSDSSDTISILGDTSSTTSSIYFHNPDATSKPPSTTAASASGNFSLLWKRNLSSITTKSLAPSGDEENSALQSFNSNDVTEATSSSSEANDSLDQFVFLDLNAEERSIAPSSVDSHRRLSSGTVIDENEPSKVAEIAPMTSSTDNEADINLISSTTTLPSNKDESSQTEEKIKDKKVSLICLSVEDGIELSFDSNETDINLIKVIAHKIILKEFGNMTIQRANTFLSLNTSKVKKYEEKKMKSPEIRMKFSVDHQNSKLLEMIGSNINQSISISTLTNLGSFMEDDSEAEIFPMKLIFKEINLQLKDDSDPVYLKEKIAPPLQMIIHSADVVRTLDGAFHISTSTSSQKKNEESSEAASSVDLPSTSSNHDTVVMSTKINEENEDLKKKLSEMMLERESLYSTIRMMQDDLMKSESERSKLQQRLLKIK